MVYRRKYQKRTGRKRVYRRRMNISRPRPRSYNGSTIVRMKRTFFHSNWTPSTASTTGFWKYFSPNFGEIPSASEMIAVFDQYKISAIKITLRPRYDGFAGNDTTDVTLPGTTAQGLTTVHVIKDPMSSVLPSGTYGANNLNAFLENGSVKSYTGTRPINIYWKPMVANTVDGATNRTKALWLSTGTAGVGVGHHGVHIFLQDNNLTGVFNQSFDVFMTYYIQFKGLK